MTSEESFHVTPNVESAGFRTTSEADGAGSSPPAASNSLYSLSVRASLSQVQVLQAPERLQALLHLGCWEAVVSLLCSQHYHPRSAVPLRPLRAPHSPLSVSPASVASRST